MNPAKNLLTHANWLCAGRPVVTSFKAVPTMLFRMLLSGLLGLLLGVLLQALLVAMGVPKATVLDWAYRLTWGSLLGMATLFIAYIISIAFGTQPARMPTIGGIAYYLMGNGQILVAMGGIVVHESKQFPAFDTAVQFAWAAIAYLQAWMYAAENILRKGVATPVGPTGTTTTPAEQTSLTSVARRPRFNGKDVEGMEAQFAAMTGAMRVAGKADRNPETKNGLLLYGKPGGGKTFLVEAAAGEVKLPLIVADIGKVNSMWTGQTTQLVTKLFDDALAQAPCVLFLDEVDSLLPDRGKITQAESETSRIVNAMLTRTVELRGSGVVLVAATNHLQRLDQAAIRDGRFDWKIEIPMPDFKARIGLLRRGLAACKKTAGQETLERLSRRWEGFDIARINSISAQVCKMATRKEVSGTELMNAYLAIRGNRGDPIPESTPSLAGVYLAEAESLRLNGLARRMSNLIETEEKGGTIPTGVLFHGASGTGKSLAARALAKETGWSFLSYKSADLLTSADAIDQMIDRARDARPAIVFLDEADDLLMDRGISQNRRYTNTLLAAMDGSVQVPDVMFVAATNHPDMLDQAMLRGGRFGQKIEFTLPDTTMVRRYLTDKSAAKPMRLKGITTDEMADMLDGLSFANIEEILKSAINHDIDIGGDGFITTKLISRALIEADFDTEE